MLANVSREDQEAIVREVEREMVRRLLERGGLEGESLHLQSISNGSGSATQIKKKRRWSRGLEASPDGKEVARAGDSEKAAHSGHDTTNEDLALFMLICMLVGQFMK